MLRLCSPRIFPIIPFGACRMLPFGELTLRKMHLIGVEQTTRHT
jgi:hypothetical protein